MKKNLIICTCACLIGLLMVLPGCDQQAKKAATPKIVRKKIQDTPVQKADAGDAKTVAGVQPVPTPMPAAKQPDTGPQPAPEAPIAQKPEADAAKTSKPKPALAPKSDISVPQPQPAPKPGVQTDREGKAIASTSQDVAAKSSSKIPPVYDPKGKIDPFEPLFKETPTVASVKKQREKRTPRTPLERIDIGQLKLVGIILAESGNKALVEEASGKGYIVKIGTYLGTNSGKVVKIEKDTVVVAEEYEDVLGNVTVRNTEIKLPKPPGEL